MGRHALNLVIDPCLEFRVERARDGRVVLVVDPVAADERPYRLELREGDRWLYSLTLDVNGFRQGNRVERVERAERALPPVKVERKGISEHFRRS